MFNVLNVLSFLIKNIYTYLFLEYNYNQIYLTNLSKLLQMILYYTIIIRYIIYYYIRKNNTNQSMI